MRQCGAIAALQWRCRGTEIEMDGRAGPGEEDFTVERLF